MEDLPKQKGGYSALPASVSVAGVLVFLMGAVVTYFLSEVWSTRQDYSFGYLMPVFALYVLFDRKEKIFGYFKSPHSNPSADSAALRFLAGAFFGAMLLCGLATFFLFAFMLIATGEKSLAFAMTFGFSFSFFALAYFCAGQAPSGVGERVRFASLFVFPAFAWLVSAPLFSAVESMISLFLLSKVAAVVYSTMGALGYVVELTGNSLVFPNGAVGVADACSGIRSLTACLFAGSFLSAVFLDKFWKQILLVAASMCLAFVNNIIRALFLSFWAYHNGPESISGFVHDAAGYFVLGMTVLGLLLLLPIFQFNPVPPEFRNAGNGAGADSSGESSSEGRDSSSEKDSDIRK